MPQDDLRPLVRALNAYLADRWPDRFTVADGIRPFGDGHSGFTYELGLTDEGTEHRAVLRIAPPGTANAGPADVGRQGRIMHALAAAPVPVPRVFAFDSGPALAGRSFALMERVTGVGWTAALGTRSAERVAADAVAVLRDLRQVDPASVGLGPVDVVSVADEVVRWQRLLPRTPEWLHGPGTELAGLLSAARPAGGDPRLVHGDFHLGNVLFGGDADAGVVAVLDWEIASLSDPLIDLASLAVAVLRRRYPTDPNPTGGLDIDPLLLAELSGAPAGELDWFVALGCLKYAAILGYNLGLHRRGRRIDPIYERLTSTMRGLLTDGTTILRSGLAALSPSAPARPPAA